MRNIRKKMISIIFSIASLLIVFLIASSIITSPIFVFRLLTHSDSSIKDYAFFPSRIIAKGENPYNYALSLDCGVLGLEIEYETIAGEAKAELLPDFINSTESTSFIIVRNDEIIYEEYANGYQRDSINTSFSMAKSVVSLLVGKAIEDGYIRSLDQSIAEYITEFRGSAMGDITIEDLLLMRSNIAYEEAGFAWFRDDAYTYWMPDLRRLALTHATLTDRYEGRMHYNNYHPLLLGIILERSTGISVSDYFEKSIWQKIGAEYDASWSLDSEKSQFEKMESGINFRSIEFIKIGSMLLHDGYWNGERIINREWLRESIFANFPIDENEYIGTFLEDKNIGYQYMWYSRESQTGDLDYMALGKYDQILYVSPSNNTVILRTGFSSGSVSDWPEVMGDIAAYCR